MLYKINSVGSIGIDSVEVSVEVNIASRGFPGFDIVGLPTKTIAESRERVKTAIINSGFKFPSDKKITVNLAPADIPKEGSFYDLPIAVGILASVINLDVPSESLFFGELSLEGTVRHTKGAFLVAILAKEKSYKRLFLPFDSAGSAGAFPELNVYPLRDLRHLIDILKHSLAADRYVASAQGAASLAPPVGCMSDVLGQEHAKRALMIAAAGGHNVLIIGPPGVGKSMLASRLVTILPPLTDAESVEVTKIYSITGNLAPGSALISSPPFRSPHHTLSYISMVGGGSKPVPGEISLAHRGVLFLDEIPEFPRTVLESLRQPLEKGSICITRNRSSVVFPTKFVLAASANPCACGYNGSDNNRCKCSPAQVLNYKKRLSGPLLDRVDLRVWVREVDISKLSGSRNVIVDPKNTSKNLKKKVISARTIQHDRAGLLNSEMDTGLVRKYCGLSKEGNSLLNSLTKHYTLSPRAYFKILKVARTLADIDMSASIQERHLAEAASYRTASF